MSRLEKVKNKRIWVVVTFSSLQRGLPEKSVVIFLNAGYGYAMSLSSVVGDLAAG